MAQKIPVVNNLTKNELYSMYGDFCDLSINQGSGNSVAIGGIIDFASKTVPVGFRCRIKSIVIRSTFGGRITGSISRAYAAQTLDKMKLTPEMNIPNGGGQIVIPWGNAVEFLEGGRLGLRIVATEAVTGYNLQITTIGAEMVTDDADTDADGVGDVAMESIGWTQLGLLGGTGTVPNLGYTQFGARICNQLKKDLKISIWRNNKSFGGAITQLMVYAMQNGYYARSRSEWARLKFVILGCGLNDAEGGDATATNYISKMKLLLNYYYQNAPKVAIILVGATPTDDPVRSPNLASYRSAMQSLVADSDYAGKELKYADMSIGFNIQNSNFTETVAGTRLHPRGDTGHVIMYNNVFPVIQTCNFYTQNLL